MNLHTLISLSRRLKRKTKAKYLMSKKINIKLKRNKFKIAIKADLS
jgi:hypothetical protein